MLRLIKIINVLLALFLVAVIAANILFYNHFGRLPFSRLDKAADITVGGARFVIPADYLAWYENEAPGGGELRNVYLKITYPELEPIIGENRALMKTAEGGAKIMSVSINRSLAIDRFDEAFNQPDGPCTGFWHGLIRCPSFRGDLFITPNTKPRLAYDCWRPSEQFPNAEVSCDVTLPLLDQIRIEIEVKARPFVTTGRGSNASCARLSRSCVRFTPPTRPSPPPSTPVKRT